MFKYKRERRIKTYFTFRSSLPDDSVWKNDDQLVPAGNAILQAIRDHTIALDFGVTYFGQRSYYGWETRLKREKLNFHAVIQGDPDEWLLIMRPERGIIPTVSPIYETVLSQMHQRLFADDRFSDIVWQTEEEYKNQMS